MSCSRFRPLCRLLGGTSPASPVTPKYLRKSQHIPSEDKSPTTAEDNTYLTNAIYHRNRNNLTIFATEKEITNRIDPHKVIWGILLGVVVVLFGCCAALQSTNKKRIFSIKFSQFLVTNFKGTVWAGVNGYSAILNEGASWKTLGRTSLFWDCHCCPQNQPRGWEQRWHRCVPQALSTCMNLQIYSSFLNPPFLTRTLDLTLCMCAHTARAPELNFRSLLFFLSSLHLFFVIQWG